MKNFTKGLLIAALACVSFVPAIKSIDRTRANQRLVELARMTGGYNPLHATSPQKKAMFVEIQSLLSQGADPNERDASGKNTFEYFRASSMDDLQRKVASGAY